MENQDPLLDNPQHQFGGSDNDELGTPLKILSFCIPLAGAIIYFTTDRTQYPNKAKQACNFALIGMAVGIAVNVLSVLATGSL